MFTYWLAVGALFFIAVALMILGIWAIAHTDTFFCFIKEGQGVIIKRGESFHRIIISYHGHQCKRTNGRWEIMPKDKEGSEYAHGFLGFLEKRFGIYWIGIYPFYKVMDYEFRWNEWEQQNEEKSGDTVVRLKYRKERTKFFYVQTFNYALLLDGAETGGKRDGKENAGGNISVNVQITLLLRIIYPQVALLQNEDWFEQLEAVVLDHARLYVGSHTYEQLHTSVHHENEGGARNEFCEYIMNLNDHAPIGKKTDGVKDAFGIEIVGAVIISVAPPKTDPDIVKATTKIYVAEQEAEATRISAEATSDKIKLIGDAEAYAMKARTQTVADFGETGMFVERQRAIIEAGRSGNTVVFTDDSEHSKDNNKLLASLLVDTKGRKVK